MAPDCVSDLECINAKELMCILVRFLGIYFKVSFHVLA